MAAQTLKLDADDQKALAIGRTLALVGSVVGVIGGLYSLSANPQVKTAYSSAWSSLPQPIQANRTFTLAIAGLLVAVVLAKMASARFDQQASSL